MRPVNDIGRLGKALAYLVGHWETLTRFLSVPGAPLDNNTAEVRFVGQKPDLFQVWGIGPRFPRDILLESENLIPVSV